MVSSEKCTYMLTKYSQLDMSGSITSLVLEPDLLGYNFHRQPTPDPPEPVYSRSGRKRKIPKAYQDYVPSSLAGMTVDLQRLIPHAPVPMANPPLAVSETAIPTDITFNEIPNILPLLHVTGPNDFGLYRCYPVRPKCDPEEIMDTTELCDSRHIDAASTEVPADPLQGIGRHTTALTRESALHEPKDQGSEHWFTPFSNPSICRIIGWQNSQTNLKSNSEVNRLIHDVITAPDFDLLHFKDFTSIEHEHQRLDAYTESQGIFLSADGWCKLPVKIRLPKEGVTYASTKAAPEFEVEGLWHRSLIGVIKSAYEDLTQELFHLIPFRVFHKIEDDILVSTPESDKQNPLGPEKAAPEFSNNQIPSGMEQVYTEMYTSDAMLEEDAKIRTLPCNPSDNDDVEYAIAPMLLYSDSTCLANFGPASLWPIYLFFAGVSKYM